MKKGLTIVELIVVIGIIGILAAIILSLSTGTTEAARSAHCLANLRTLASAVHSAAGSVTLGTVQFPLAGSLELFSEDTSQGTENTKEVYTDTPGWISWDSQSQYPSEDAKASASWTVSAYSQSEEARLYALTNGSLWRYTHSSRSVYLCPEHEKRMRKKGLDPLFSYAMNAYFVWSPNPGEDLHLASSGYGITSMARAERRLLFAEIQFLEEDDVDFKAVTDSGYETDAILQYKGCAEGQTFTESIGFNHKSGNFYQAHVAFQDGHVEKLRYPQKGLSDSDKAELTQWLCEAKDVAYDAETNRYKEME